MNELCRQTLERLDRGERVVWCLILEAQGSTPRGPGARMAVLADGGSLGTVGGGAVELQAVRLAAAMTGNRALVRDFDLHSGGDEATGMICGGQVKLAFLPLNAGHRAFLEALAAQADSPEARWLELILRPQGDFSLDLIRDADLHSETPRLPRRPTLSAEAGALRYVEPVSRREQVWLFGGGHVGRALVPVLLPLGFAVTVYDPRPELVREARFPGARVLLGDYGRIAETISVGEGDYAVVMTPEHRMDLTVLRQLLGTPATYIGCIGSRRKTAFVNQALRDEGFSEAEIARIHAPIGLPIGARTPEEIAVSIAAQLIQHRAGK